MSSLTNYKSEIVQTVNCELDMLKKGNRKCANMVLKFRNEAMLRLFIMECLMQEDPVPQDMVNFLFEEIKEITRFLIKNKCLNSNC
jgi:hypothetical protein